MRHSPALSLHANTSYIRENQVSPPCLHSAAEAQFNCDETERAIFRQHTGVHTQKRKMTHTTHSHNTHKTGTHTHTLTHHTQNRT